MMGSASNPCTVSAFAQERGHEAQAGARRARLRVVARAMLPTLVVCSVSAWVAATLSSGGRPSAGFLAALLGGLAALPAMVFRLRSRSLKRRLCYPLLVQAGQHLPPLGASPRRGRALISLEDLLSGPQTREAAESGLPATPGAQTWEAGRDLNPPSEASWTARNQTVEAAETALQILRSLRPLLGARSAAIQDRIVGLFQQAEQAREGVAQAEAWLRRWSQLAASASDHSAVPSSDVVNAQAKQWRDRQSAAESNRVSCVVALENLSLRLRSLSMELGPTQEAFCLDTRRPARVHQMLSAMEAGLGGRAHPGIEETESKENLDDQ